MNDMSATKIMVVVVFVYVSLGLHHLSVSWKISGLDQLLRTQLIESTSTGNMNQITYDGQLQRNKLPTRGNEPC